MTSPSNFAIAASLILAGTALIAYAPTADSAAGWVLKITNSSADPIEPFEAFDGNPPKVYDINGDGDLEIIAQNDNQWVYVFDSRTGAILFQAKTNFPPGWEARTFNGPEVAITKVGGKPRLIVANSAATITSYQFDPTASTSTKFAFVKKWDTRLTSCHSNPGMDSKPVLADLDKDGKLEILAGTEESGVYALRQSGAILWVRCIGGGNAEPTVGDLNMDGWPDVVHGSDGGIVTAMNGRTGSTMWKYNVRANFNVGSGSMPVGPTIAQLDGAGGPDVVVGVRDSHDANNFDNNHALLLALDHTGKLLWGKQDPNANPLTYTHPIVVDAGGDGSPEVYWGDWNTMGHKPGNWETMGDANYYRFSKTGSVVWRQTLDTFWSNKDLAMADVDGDGKQEVLANGPSGGHDGIWSLDASTGATETFIDMYPWQAQRGPIVADLYDTNKMQLVIQAEPMSTSEGAAIMVYDTDRTWNSKWPHLPYPNEP